ncbi:NADH:ubiquinone oxidoreductase [Dimargaris verticillata]|uniref:NADH:ubiquinone reductase (non-electrogenic) n=1 Tax=Dimargaris verticillata TaxID=2761393 RepID=A0A9W8EEG8_9FUNG|nr:NADH:ubiquinone oxidoreductase [Dimargaris verticillata]
MASLRAWAAARAGVAQRTRAPLTRSVCDVKLSHYGRTRTLAALSTTAYLRQNDQSSASNDQSTKERPTPPPRSSRWRSVKYLIYATLAGGLSYGATKVYFSRHPQQQMEPDSSKQTLVILGTGWGATALLKGIDTSLYNVVVVSPRNYFMFTPLLPSCTVGTIEHRSIMEPIRYITRHKQRAVHFYEASCTHIDPEAKTITVEDLSEVKGDASKATLSYDYLVVAVGAESNTFGIKGVEEHACFLKEIWDAKKIRTKLMDCIESAAFPGQSSDEVERLLHMVVVGGGPTGVEYAGELHDFLAEDLVDWYPHLSDKIRLTLIEAQSTVLPMFSRQLIEYTESTFKSNKIDIMTNSMVKEVTDKYIVLQDANKEIRKIPYGLLVWATGNTQRAVVRNLIQSLSHEQTSKRGLLVDEFLRVKGGEGIWAIGDATFTKYAPLAQVANQQGFYLAKFFNRMAQIEERRTSDLAQAQTTDDSAEPDATDFVHAKADKLLQKLRPFRYTSQGSLAYIGADRAIADLPFLNTNISSSGFATYLFWKSAYINLLFNTRNQAMVTADWVKKTLFGRDISRE